MVDEPTEAMMHEDALTPDSMILDTATHDAMMHETLAQDTMIDITATPQGMMESPDWYGAEFVNATTGEQFSIQDYDGKSFWWRRWRSGVPPAAPEAGNHGVTVLCFTNSISPTRN